MLNHKRCVLHFVQEWANIVGVAFKEDYTINAFLEELQSCVMDDLQDYPSLKDDIASLDSILTAQKGSPNNKCPLYI
ncbi:Rap guanine nucleotide exchange factor 4 [Mactra antiquata]